MTERLRSTVTAIVPCSDVDAAERWWNKLGFSRPAEQDFGDYRMLSDGEGGEVHLQAAVEGWLVPGQNPFGVYIYTRRVDELAALGGDAIIEQTKGAVHTEWGMYEFALNGPDDLLVRVGWPSRLL